MSALFAGLGLLGQYFQSAAERKGLNNALDWQKMFEGPNLEAKKKALALVTGYFLPQIGKESPTIAAEHQLNEQQLARASARARRASERYAFLTGNRAGARGLEWQKELGFEGAMSEENLRAAKAQQEYKLQNALTAENILTALGSGGTSVPGLLAAKGQAAGGFWSGVSGLVGDLAGESRWNQMNKTLTPPPPETSTTTTTTSAGTDTMKKSTAPIALSPEEIAPGGPPNRQVTPSYPEGDLGFYPWWTRPGGRPPLDYNRRRRRSPYLLSLGI